MNYLRLSLFASALLATAAFAADVKLPSVAKLPSYTQAHTYTDSIKNLTTDIFTEAGSVSGFRRLKYSELPNYQALDEFPVGAGRIPSQDLYIDTKTAVWQPYMIAAEPENNRAFNFKDLNDIYFGTYHCSPAAAAMLMEFNAQKAGIAKLGIGARTETQFVADMSMFLDTNDINPNLRKDFVGTMGTRIGDIPSGITAYAKDRVGNAYKTTTALKAFGFDAFKKEIDADRAVLVNFRSPNAAILHTVLGMGYLNDPVEENRRLIVFDPDSGIERYYEVPEAVSDIAAANGSSGYRLNLNGDITISDYSASEPLTDGTMVTFDIQAVPEPTTLAALGLGALALLRRRHPSNPR